MTLYNNKYRIESARLRGWDYSSPGYYFITICTQNREYLFGDIINGEMVLSGCGEIAHQIWQEIPDHFDNIRLDNFVVMPDHIHGIIIIDRDAINSVSINNGGGITGEYNPMMHQNISRIIRWYKGRTTFESRKIKSEFAWQGRFHDHIIRDQNALNSIRKYILQNPKNWKKKKKSFPR